MIQRRVVVPADVERLWHALTDPEEAGRWLGGRLDWDPEPGTGFTFVPDRGSRREGRVEEVVPGRHMRFLWWPADGEPDQVSEVAYTLEPVAPGTDEDVSPAGESTILTVEEAPARVPAASASASGWGSVASWTFEDEVLWRAYARRELAGALAR